MNMHLTVGGQTADLTNGPSREFAPGRLTLRGQAGVDFAKLELLCPTDQERTFRGRWVGAGVFEFEEVHDAADFAALDPAGANEPTGDPAADAAAAELALANARKAAVAAERKKLANKSKADLQEQAAQVGVAWEDSPRASRDTMITRIAEAIVAKAAG